MDSDNVNCIEYLKPVSFLYKANEIIVRGNLVSTSVGHSSLLFSPVVQMEKGSLDIPLSKLSQINSFMFTFNSINYINSIVQK